ncbi:OLC1v1017889C1 [Oldenlandia corymbosa var. corymbosa]|uniref:OLC1v1017889C1 n=1 Tax=Oldenlandia corymbosa var. corymbosa TaxID=529605 RepID=A0AAV1EAG3_OLDCO|nr:OLC1v1017889C1 [Oldenlandia corymbosa var. corymbosa]
MSSLAPGPIADVVLNEFDEQAIMLLEKLWQDFPLPDDVIDSNPFQFKPYNLSGEIWYLVSATEEEKSEFQFWSEIEAASEIFVNSAISVWRTAWEFIDVQDAQEQKTIWLMLEYKITEVGPHGTKIGKDSRAICRVYHSAEAERLNGNLALSLASVVPQRDTTYTKGSPSVLLAHNGGDTEQLTAGDYSHLDLQMTSDLNQMFEDDYVALDDLDALISNSTTSGNPSCLTMFLLNDENDDKQLNSGSDERLDPQRRDASGLYYIKDDDYIELDDLATLMSNGNGAQKFNYGADKRLDPQRIGKHIMEDDYLELDDLDDPLSLSTTSDNSSRSSFNLDEYFDPGAMMQALNRNINSSIGSTVSPFEVIMPPATAGSYFHVYQVNH